MRTLAILLCLLLAVPTPAALTFGAATSDKVDCGSAANLDNLDPFTALLWIYPTTLTAGRGLFCKGAGSGNLRVIRIEDPDEINVIVWGSSFGSLATNNANLTVNTWWFVALVFDSAAGTDKHVYVGNLTTPAVETTYAANNDSGTPPDDNTYNLKLGNRDSETVAFQGRIATVAYVNKAMTLTEIKQWQGMTLPTLETKLSIHLGLNGTTVVTDWSGQANTCTVTGATTAAHVPIGWFTPGLLARGLDRIYRALHPWEYALAL